MGGEAEGTAEEEAEEEGQQQYKARIRRAAGPEAELDYEEHVASSCPEGKVHKTSFAQGASARPRFSC